MEDGESGEGPENVKLTVQRSKEFLWNRENVSMVASREHGVSAAVCST